VTAQCSRRKRRVRIHQILGGPTSRASSSADARSPATTSSSSPRSLEERDDGEVRDRKLDAEQVEIPKDRVIAIEVLGS
jgi:hypothetical protein